MAQGVSYKIKGQLPKAVNSEVFLVATDDKGTVAIGNSTIKDGVFAFEGSVPMATVVYLVPKDGKTVWATLFLTENGEFTVSTDTSGAIVVDGGGENQKIFREYEALNKDLMKVKQHCEQKAKSITDPKLINELQAVLNEAALQAQNKFIDLLKKHNDSFASAYIIASSMSNLDEKVLNERYDLLGANAKSSAYGESIATQIARLEKVAVGGTAPDFSATMADGGSIKLYNVDAKVKIVYFWVAGALPCRNDHANMLNLYKQYSSKGLEIIGISLDPDNLVWQTALGEDGVTWKNISDSTGEIINRYCVSSIPAIFVLDEKNQIVAKNLRDKDLNDKIEEMLNKK